MSTVTILGLGAMGSRMARRLLEAGHRVTVYNRTAERAEALRPLGASVASTPRQAAAGAELVISMLTDDEASRSTWLHRDHGALLGLAEGALAIESSTLTLDWVRELAAAVDARGGRFLDAPVAGSRPQAEAGQLIYLVGGADGAVAAARGVLDAMGGALHHVGPPGHGMAMKLAVNALFGVQVAAMGEILGMLHNAGVEIDRAVEILASTPVSSPASKVAATAMTSESFAPLFPIDLVAKDFRFIVDSARSVGAEVPTAAAVGDVYARAVAGGYGGDHIAGVVQLFR